MSIKLNGTEIKDFILDGTGLEKIIFNGTTVWQKEIIEVIMRIKSLLGNQKMNLTKDTITTFCAAFQEASIPADKADVVLFPQTCLIDHAAQVLSGSSIKVGAQLCSPMASGAYTGQNSVDALYSCGARFFYINNYEVLSYLGGVDLNYAGQVQRVFEKSDTVAVVEVADNLEEHEAGYDAIESRFGEMFSNLNMAVNVQQMITGNRLRFAYAPVWAIGTGKTCSPAQADAYMQILRNIIKSDSNTEVAQSAIMYFAGAVNPNNFPAFLAQDDIDGGVAGGAALNPNNFGAMISQLLQAAGA